MRQRGDDTVYARTLLTMLHRDCERLTLRRDWCGIVLWMAEEVASEARRLHVPSSVAMEMREAADFARARVRDAQASGFQRVH